MNVRQLVKLLTEFGERVRASSSEAVQRERVLVGDDAHCPHCGHNRDTSSVSSLDHEDGTHSCQQCGAGWRELPASPRRRATSRSLL